jgi:hypothetical protein
MQIIEFLRVSFLRRALLGARHPNFQTAKVGFLMACSGFLVLQLLRGDARARIATLIVSNGLFVCGARWRKTKKKNSSRRCNRTQHIEISSCRYMRAFYANKMRNTQTRRYLF